MQLAAHTSSIGLLSERRVTRTHIPRHAAVRHVGSPKAYTAARQQAAAIPCSSPPVGTNAVRSSRRSVTAAAGNVPDVLDTVIVGAGISGLVTAQALATKHSDKVQSFLVTEGRERVGGNITSMQSDGYIWEEGPNSFQPNDAMLQAAVSSSPGKIMLSA